MLIFDLKKYLFFVYTNGGKVKKLRDLKSAFFNLHPACHIYLPQVEAWSQFSLFRTGNIVKKSFRFHKSIIDKKRLMNNDRRISISNLYKSEIVDLQSEISWFSIEVPTARFFGSETKNLQPWFCSDSIFTEPPCDSAILFAINKPNPVPPAPLDEKNRLNAFSRVSLSIPIPLSDTSNNMSSDVLFISRVILCFSFFLSIRHASRELSNRLTSSDFTAFLSASKLPISDGTMHS